MTTSIVDHLQFQLSQFEREGIADRSRLRVQMTRERFDTYNATDSSRLATAPTFQSPAFWPPTFWGVPIEVVSGLPEPGARVVALAP